MSRESKYLLLSSSVWLLSFLGSAVTLPRMCKMALAHLVAMESEMETLWLLILTLLLAIVCATEQDENGTFNFIGVCF